MFSNVELNKHEHITLYATTITWLALLSRPQNRILLVHETKNRNHRVAIKIDREKSELWVKEDKVKEKEEEEFKLKIKRRADTTMVAVSIKRWVIWWANSSIKLHTVVSKVHTGRQKAYFVCRRFYSHQDYASVNTRVLHTVLHLRGCYQLSDLSPSPLSKLSPRLSLVWLFFLKSPSSTTKLLPPLRPPFHPPFPVLTRPPSTRGKAGLHTFMVVQVATRHVFTHQQPKWWLFKLKLYKLCHKARKDFLFCLRGLSPSIGNFVLIKVLAHETCRASASLRDSTHEELNPSCAR